NLPYSVEEIYGIRNSGKYVGLKQVYHEFYHIYGDHFPGKVVHPDEVVVEDSNSGYEFFKGILEGKALEVVSAGGKSKIFDKTCKISEKTVLVIADGAAFGAEMDRMMKLISKNKNIVLFLPESFEWLILSAGIIPDGELKKILDDPAECIESSEYFSWERFFTRLLVEKTLGSYLKYAKERLNPSYLQEGISKKIIAQIRDVELN
ncbi:MAG: translation initiation factor 2, partial [Lachnospiraceae bacterium]|nr:translation initiation factor 2 [Lachnospiraceae bacterium]